MTCGKVLADKWEAYVRRCAEADAEANGKEPPPPRVEKTAQGRVLDELGLVNICCRIAMQTHVDMSLII